MINNISGYVRHFVACNKGDLDNFVPFSIGGKLYGYISKNLAAFLPSAGRAFEFTADGGIALSSGYSDFSTRSAALAKAAQWIAEYNSKKLRHEMYAVVEKWGDEPVAQIDRAAIPWFGIRAWGIHVNGYVRKPDGIYLWIGERAADRPADPGKLDNLIGGGQPIGLTLEENLCKEAKEEAGIEAPLALTSKPVQTINYNLERNGGMRRDTLFVYDLELSPDFTPRNTDGEVAAFHLMPLPQVAALVRDTDQFKFNCTLVVIGFLMRHGFLKPEDTEYAELSRWLAN